MRGARAVTARTLLAVPTVEAERLGVEARRDTPLEAALLAVVLGPPQAPGKAALLVCTSEDGTLGRDSSASKHRVVLTIGAHDRHGGALMRAATESCFCPSFPQGGKWLGGPLVSAVMLSTAKVQLRSGVAALLPGPTGAALTSNLKWVEFVLPNSGWCY